MSDALSLEERERRKGVRVERAEVARMAIAQLGGVERATELINRHMPASAQVNAKRVEAWKDKGIPCYATLLVATLTGIEPSAMFPDAWWGMWRSRT